MAEKQPPSKPEIAKHLNKMLDSDMSLGDRAAITRTIQILKGER